MDSIAEEAETEDVVSPLLQCAHPHTRLESALPSPTTEEEGALLRRRQAQTTAATLRVADYKAAAKKRGSQVRSIVNKASVIDLAFLCDTTGSVQARRPRVSQYMQPFDAKLSNV